MNISTIVRVTIIIIAMISISLLLYRLMKWLCIRKWHCYAKKQYEPLLLSGSSDDGDDDEDFHFARNNVKDNRHITQQQRIGFLM